MAQTIERPQRSEAADYFFTYIDQVPAGDIRSILDTQGRETASMLRSISDEKSLHRYGPDKWTIREVVSHINDTERLFVFRAFWFARGYDTELPSFDQDIAIKHAGADQRPWHSHLDEFDSIRASTQAFFSNLPDDAWGRLGVASARPFSVRALAFITAGHVAHHMRILREKYL